MSRNTLDPELIAELEEIAAGEECELLSAGFRGEALEIILDRPDEDVTLVHCEKVSKQASALLDVLEFGNRPYHLVVSSPGLDRELYGPKDYRRFIGRLARLKFRDPEDGNKKTIVARLMDFSSGDNSEDTIRIEELLSAPKKPKGKPKTREHLIPLSAIETARLEIAL